MYQSDFLCTYKLHSDDEQEDFYRLQLLQAFGLEKWDDDHIENETAALFKKVSENNDFIEILNHVKNSDNYKMVFTLMGKDDYTLFKILFMYELFDLAHKCFCDILNDKIIKPENKNMLLNNI